MNNKPLFVNILMALVIGLSAELVIFASSASAPADASILLGSIGAVIIVSTIAILMVGAGRSHSYPTEKSVATVGHLPEYQRQGLDTLCRLPQFRRLDETSAIDYRTGTLISPCNCTECRNPHLAASLGGRTLLGFVTPESLSQYIAVQTALAPVIPPIGEVL
jgi:hypothetical protein